MELATPRALAVASRAATAVHLAPAVVDTGGLGEHGAILEQQRLAAVWAGEGHIYLGAIYSARSEDCVSSSP